MTDFFSTATASFDDPIALLMACHERVNHYAQLLVKLADHLPKSGSDEQARQAAAAILRYFDIAAPLHHQDEDEDLFPLLAERGDDALRSLVSVAMLSDHAELAGLWQQVRPILLEIEAGRAVELPTDLAEHFARRYPEHARIEDEQIYPYAEQLLTRVELDTIGNHMAERRGAAKR